jgi:alpha-beta hydrolase superfamily lysophospholipase
MGLVWRTLSRRPTLTVLRNLPTDTCEPMQHPLLPFDRQDRDLARQQRRGWLLILAAAVAGGGFHANHASAQPAEAAGAQRETLQTSDGVDLALWYYPAATETAVATVILVHDLGSSHTALESLAVGLQAAGMSVVAPDLRGHGESTQRRLPSGSTEELEANRLLKRDLEAIAMSQGGRVREQAQLRGDLETVYQWIRRTARSDQRLSATKLCLLGSGLGGTLSSVWTAVDAAWPPLAAGPQGGNVKAICLISPVFSLKGATIGPALQTQSLSRDLPLLMLAGERDRDASRIFGQLKRTRATEWFEQKPDGTQEQAKEVENPTTDASLFLLAYASSETADGLAKAGSQAFVPTIADFFAKQLAK